VFVPSGLLVGMCRVSCWRRYVVMYRDTARDGGAGWWGSTACGSRGLTPASPSSFSAGEVAFSAVIADRDSCIGHCGDANVVF
jgi:hypothetical protein